VSRDFIINRLSPRRAKEKPGGVDARTGQEKQHDAYIPMRAIPQLYSPDR
jgi:hypothetical protein